jgi:hypothetical protein
MTCQAVVGVAVVVVGVDVGAEVGVDVGVFLQDVQDLLVRRRSSL